MVAPQTLVVFAIDGIQYALDLSCVERVLHAFEFVPLPGAPAVVLGVLNLQGRPIPLVDIRKRFGLPPRPLLPSDEIVIARAGGRFVALPVDSVRGVRELAAGATVPAEEIFSHVPYVDGIARTEDELVIIHDLDRFLSLSEQRILDHALSSSES